MRIRLGDGAPDRLSGEWRHRGTRRQTGDTPGLPTANQPVAVRADGCGIPPAGSAVTVRWGVLCVGAPGGFGGW
jgi:hypothetical protein